MKITKKMLREYIDYTVAPNYIKNLNEKGLNRYEKELIEAIKRKQRIKI